jgi:hypothetical protein
MIQRGYEPKASLYGLENVKYEGVDAAITYLYEED